MDLKKLVNALEAIKECCLEQEDCCSCPMRSPYSPYECGMTYFGEHCRRSPNTWEFETKEWGETLFK